MEMTIEEAGALLRVLDNGIIWNERCFPYRTNKHTNVDVWPLEAYSEIVLGLRVPALVFALRKQGADRRAVDKAIEELGLTPINDGQGLDQLDPEQVGRLLRHFNAAYLENAFLTAYCQSIMTVQRWHENRINYELSLAQSKGREIRINGKTSAAFTRGLRG